MPGPALKAVALTLDDHDPRVMAAKISEKQLFDFYAISYSVRHVVLARYGIKVRITETGQGDPVVIVPGSYFHKVGVGGVTNRPKVVRGACSKERIYKVFPGATHQGFDLEP